MRWNVVLVLVVGIFFSTNLLSFQMESTPQSTDTSISAQDITADSLDSLGATSDTAEVETPEKLEPKLADVSDGSRSIPIHVLKIYDDMGQQIFPDLFPEMPFSTKQTCQECHTYEIINTGWHFNYTDSSVSVGRRGQPWILYDQITGTQLPVSYRPWAGTYQPKEVYLTNFKFTQLFGRHLPGGGAGVLSEDDPPELFNRWIVSGHLEINCLSCHSANPEQDQAEFATHVARENFRWATAVSSGLARGDGSARNMPDNYDLYLGMDPNDPKAIPPSVTYKKELFDEKNQLFFDVKRKALAERCYFCHSTSYLEEGKSEKWQMDEDVHMRAGMTCVDCHRNGLNHKMVRGYEGEYIDQENPLASSLTCKGCHLGIGKGDIPLAGRLGAPYPTHDGIPSLHFDMLSCTACHSGPWPSSQVNRIKTSRANALGTRTVSRNREAIPQLVAPVYVKGESGKIEPHKLFWPSFWAEIKGDTVKPLDLEIVREVVLEVLASDTLTDSLNYAKILDGIWPDLSKEKLADVLKHLSSRNILPGFVGGGKLFRLSDETIQISNHPAAQPYSWPFAHDVRPASQSLGIRSCGDCHDNDAGFHFGRVTIQTPLTFTENKGRLMTSFQDINTFYARVFSFTFLFRPWLKVVIFLCCFIIGAVVLLYGLKGLATISESGTQTN
jgi:hypothetical protein